MTPVPRTVLRLTAALVCSAGLLVTAPGLASAAEWKHTDPARDVRIGTMDSDSGRAAPRVRQVDVRRVSVDHSADAVTVRIRTRGALPGKKVFVTVFLRTPTGTFEATHMKLFGETHSGLSQDLDDIECPGFVINLAGKVTTVTVPTSCIGTPPWIRVGVGVGQLRAKQWIADDGLRRGIDTTEGDLRLSGRIARG